MYTGYEKKRCVSISASPALSHTSGDRNYHANNLRTRFMPPLRICTLLFAFGILLVNRIQISPLVIPFLFVSGFCCIFIFLASQALLPRRFVSLHALWQSSVLYAVSLICGSCTYFVHTSLSSVDIANAGSNNTPLTVAGEVVSISHKATYSELHLKTHRVYRDTLFFRVRGLLLVRTPHPIDSWTPGTHVLLNGTITPIQGKRNPGDFDYRSFLAQSNIHAVMDTKQWFELQVPLSLFSRIRQFIHYIRASVQAAITIGAPSEATSALLIALVLGQQAHMDATILNHFRMAGLSHLLAVSGLHVLCVGLIFYAILRPLCLRCGMRWRLMETSRTMATLAVMCVYLLLTDFKPAVFRATVMTGIFILAPLFQRPAFSLNNLFVAAFLLLALNPTYLFQPGFQLSFAAVSSIIHFYPLLPKPPVPSNLFGPPMEYIASSFNVSLAALIGTLPITLYYFQIAAPGGLFMNMAAIPATMGVLMSGILLLLSTPLSPDLAALYGASADLCAQFLLFIVSNGATYLPAVSLAHLPQLGPACLLIGILVFLLTSLEIKKKGASFCFLLSILLCIQWAPILKQMHYPQLEVLFFDVGHGDAALVKFPNGRSMLVDTGDIAWKPHTHVLTAHVHRYGITCIDAIILTHPDRDHTGGLQSLDHQQCATTIYTSGDTRFNKNLRASVASATLLAGHTLALDPHVSIRILSPVPSLVNQRNSNEGSIVLTLEYGTTRFLFLGDAEQEAEQHLLTNYPAFLSSQVIKIGHHGSRTSSTVPLVEQATEADIQYAIASTGPHSRYGLPDEEIIERWKAQGGTVHITAQSGALWLSSNGVSIKEKKW